MPYNRESTNKKEDQETSYGKWKSLHKFSTTKNNREQFEVVEQVLKEFQQAKTARENGCYWNNISDGTSKSSSSGGGDWAKWWSNQEKLWSMWFQPMDGDDFRSNVKSPMTTGRVESTLHKFKKINLQWDAKPDTEADVGKEKIANVLLDTWSYRSNAKAALATWVKDALIHGTAIARVSYQVKKQDYRFPKKAADILKELDKEKKTQMEEELAEGKVVWGETEEKYKYQDIVLEPIPLADFYVDPQARCLHGESYEARYVIRRRVISYDDFKLEFCKDPNAFNTDKVKSISLYTQTEDYKFFAPPKDVYDSDCVQILEYENQATDTYAVVANDILVKHSPLPYNHKELTFHKLDCIEFVHQFYHVGIPDFLANIQGTQEILLNLMLDYIFRSMNMKYMVDGSIFGEFTESHMRDDSQYIPVDTSDGQPLSSKVQQLGHQPIGFDAFRINDILSNLATMSSQISETQIGLATGGRDMPATLGMINKEQVELMLASLIDNFSGGGLLTAGRQIWALMQQMYTVEEVKKATDSPDKKAEQSWRTVRLDGLELKTDNGALDIVASDKQYTFMQLKTEYLNTKKDLDIRISPDSLQVISRGLEMQKSREAYAQLMPNAVDPTDTAQMQAMKSRGITPLWDAVELAKYYQETNIMPSNLRIAKDTLVEIDVEQARDESEEMLSGKSVVGQAGRSKAHTKYQAQVLNKILEQIQDITMIVEDKMANTPAETDPMTGEGVLPTIEDVMDAGTKELLEKLEKAKQLFQKHIIQDVMPAEMFTDGILEASAAMQPVAQMMAPQQQPMMPGMPGMQMPGIPGMTMTRMTI